MQPNLREFHNRVECFYRSQSIVMFTMFWMAFEICHGLNFAYALTTPGIQFIGWNYFDLNSDLFGVGAKVDSWKRFLVCIDDEQHPSCTCHSRSRMLFDDDWNSKIRYSTQMVQKCAKVYFWTLKHKDCNLSHQNRTEICSIDSLWNKKLAKLMKSSCSNLTRHYVT